ncbi:MAG: glycoside hydrolase family 88 protein [Marinilabiliaceae bacterium]|nr:glycoside hydrolase family 88 protein [Marinilabiliaceae bacterium]
MFVACNPPVEKKEKYSVWMAKSEMKRFPEGWMMDFAKKLKWGYCQGIGAKMMLDVYDTYGDSVFLNYAVEFGDTIITPEGVIRTYNMSKYNIDNVNGGKALFRLYKYTGDEKYKIAMDTLRKQMLTHPRTSEGGFWHKKIYPHQMWLDGLYMGSPFLAEYAATFNEPELFNEVSHQLLLMAKVSYDKETGLFYHAWDESREQQWADKETGLSPNFWGRSIGWYAMSLVDAMDFMPDTISTRDSIIRVIGKVAAGIKKYQDEKTGLWYQVVDQGGREGNYLEATCSSMYTYFLYKAVRKGYLSAEYLQVANKAYDGIINNLIKENEDGTISLTQCCSVAGLGGNPYRDGSYEYYVGEPIRDNDPKGTGPFIWASLEREMLNSDK